MTKTCENMVGIIEFTCCDSCHDDLNGGHTDEMIKVIFRGEKYHVCCFAIDALKEARLIKSIDDLEVW